MRGPKSRAGLNENAIEKFNEIEAKMANDSTYKSAYPIRGTVQAESGIPPREGGPMEEGDSLHQLQP